MNEKRSDWKHDLANLLRGLLMGGADIIPGVSQEIAFHRAKTISEVEYDLIFSIPDSLSDPIYGKETISFNITDLSEPVILDFNEKADNILSVKTDGETIDYEFFNEHIIIPASVLRTGKNNISIEFIAGEKSLNRNKNYLYTLFVPDRASTAFPCFDQPDMKAKYKLVLETPRSWIAVANGELIEKSLINNGNKYEFAKTEILSTYLFSFVAGEFEVISEERNARKISMYHRETNTEKVERNLKSVFDLHFNALDWLEEYTNIPYPFDKFDFVLIPSFQYGGMEHPGAILYRASRILLEESATLNQKLGRANLISHETSHMWFGDLVTMKWFDDVWLKEVYANFMAGKIVNPNFPEIDHELRFLLTNYPRAYAVDRTMGANPIGQVLRNLKNAGTLYGSIIYHKAPIIMNHLEIIMGKEKLKEGLREYLSTFSFSNATWDELIEILDKRVDIDLKAWSKIWVYEAGMPTIKTEISYSSDNKISSFSLIQADPYEKGRIWAQNLNPFFSWQEKNETISIQSDNTSVSINEVIGWEKPDFLLPNGASRGYGYFELDENSKNYLLENVYKIDDPLIRGISYLNLWENMLNVKISPQQLINMIVKAIPYENNTQNINLILGYLQTVFWKFHTPAEQKELAPVLENLLWNSTVKTSTQNLKSSFFRAYRSLAISDKEIQNLYKIWKKDIIIEGLTLSEDDFTKLAYELAVRDVKKTNEILYIQLERIQNPDRKERMKFIIPAFKNEQTDRDNFFNSLKDEKNRHTEPWVIQALNYFHHPLRGRQLEKYILPSLEMLEEIQVTGDIFFPKQWLDATFSGYNSLSAANTVRNFLEKRPDYPKNLKGKVLQSADLLFRSAAIVNK